MRSKFEKELAKKALAINETLGRLLEDNDQIDADLREAMRYTLEAPGKRIRSALVLWCCEAAGGRINRNAEVAAAAIEMVHTYSLIHDDLPAMDDDDFRRGRLTCHKKFDEATAILAGDALLTFAFEVLAKEIEQSSVAVKLMGQLAEAAGPAGMIAGQMADLKAENVKGSKELLEKIHINKTAKMFRAACEMGAIAGGANIIQLRAMSEYGLKIGLGFQIADDILDVSASSEQLGKTAGKDVKAGKLTYPAVVGMKKSTQTAKKLADEAVEMLKPFGKDAQILKQIAMALLKRKK